MKLLFLTSRLPWPPDRGDRLRTYNLLIQLSKNHEITLVSFYAKQRELIGSEAITDICENVHFVYLPVWRSVLSVILNFWRGRPLQVEYYRSSKMKRLIERLIENNKFSAVYIHLFRMAPYFANKQNYYRIVDLTDAISQEILKSLPYRSMISRFIHKVEQNRIAKFECQVAGWAEESWLISDNDKQYIFQSCNIGNLSVIPNGVNLQMFFPIENAQRKFDLIFVGNLDVFHNVDAITFLVLEIFPLICSEMPDCRLAIVGAGKGKEIKKFQKIPGVTLLGFVKDLNDSLNDANVFIAPLRFSAGIQNKILEAMACALPVLSTRDIASSIGAAPGKEILTAEKAADFAENALSLLSGSELRQKVGWAGRNFVAKNFSWQEAADRMKIIERNLESVDS